MSFTFIQAPNFSRVWRNHYELGDDDLRALEEQLAKVPLAGRVMRNTGGVRKVRFSPSGRHGGKSGGFRVAYVFVPDYATFYLLLIFSKSDQPNLTPAQEQLVRRLAEAARDSLR